MTGVALKSCCIELIHIYIGWDGLLGEVLDCSRFNLIYVWPGYVMKLKERQC